jgi:cyclophilin family peptidyl-prolyl cis-trans isomerase
MRRLVPLLAVLAVAVLVGGCGGGGDDDGGAEAGGCENVEAPEPRAPGDNEKPSQPLDASETWALVFDTTCGEFTVTLDLDSAPNTTASLVALAQAGYFDDTVFHRIVPDFVIQGGDPTQSGGGGPGYQTVDPPAQDARYTKGVVAMAKTETEAPGTSGSQFFVVTDEDSGLTPDYAIVGEVTEGLDVVERIGELGDPASGGAGTPTMPVVVRSVTVSENPS